MRKITCVLVTLAFASALFAALPFAGTWKLDPAKSKGADVPKDATLVIQEQGDDVEIAVSGTSADGTPLSIKYTTPEKGGPGKVMDGPYDSVTTKVPNDHTRETTYMKGGKEVRHTIGELNKDATVLTVKVKGVDAKGKHFSMEEVFDRQN